MNPQHMAKYLVLMRHKEAQRALLFNGDHCFLSELIDDNDGSLVEALLQSGKSCVPPQGLSLEAVVPAPPAGVASTCYALS